MPPVKLELGQRVYYNKILPMELLSISTAPLTSYLRKKYYDLKATVYIMKMLVEEGVLDGFEFQLLAEWNPDYPPLNKDTKYDRKFEWENSRKYDTEEIVGILLDSGFPILSVHADYDIGICLCSGNKQLVDRGKELIEKALYLTEKVGAEICVFHLWDTWMEEVDFKGIREFFSSVVRDKPDIKATVENIPTYSKTVTPFDIVNEYDWITLDTKWAEKYDELARFASIKDRIVNIHINVSYRGGRWLADDSHARFLGIMSTVESIWESSNLLTVDPSAGFVDTKWKDLVSGISSLKH